MSQSKLSASKKVLMKKTLGVVQNTVTKFFALDELFKRSRVRRYVEARQMFAHYCFVNIINKSTGKPMFNKSEIGSYMNYDHASIVHSLKSFENLHCVDVDYRNDFESLSNKIDRKLLLVETELRLKDELIEYIEKSDKETAKDLFRYIVRNKPNLVDIFDYRNYDSKNMTSTLN